MSSRNEKPPVRGKLVGVKEASDRIFMKKTWIYGHMKAGTLPFPYFLLSQGKRGFDTADLDDFLMCRKIPAAKKPQGGFL